DPTDSAKVYAGTSDGIFKSVDSGTTWVPTSTGLPASSFSPVASVPSLVIDPRNPSVLYATFDQGPHQGGGVAKSQDGGSTWRTIRGLAGGGLLTMDPEDSSKLFVSVNGIAGTSVFVTANGGATWNLIPFFFSFRLGGFAIDPIAGSNVYAGGIRIWK